MPAKDKPKSIDKLMLYLRDVKGINISGHEQKQKLMNMGYYHGYKGYRYIGNPNKKAPFSDFSQLAAVYEFDTQIKAIFYPHVVFIETALKNYVLESIISCTESDDLTVIYNKVLDRHSEYYPGPRSNSTGKNRSDAEKRYRSALKRRLELRNRIYKIQSDAFGNDNRIAMHYLYNDNSIPIWALFELMSLGEFGHFVSCINKDCRIKTSKSIGFRQSDDTNGIMLQRVIYAIKDFRNAIAHNDIVFDTRFKTGNIDTQISATLKNDLGIENVTFATVTDYLVLVVYLLNLLHAPANKISGLISDYEKAAEELRSSVPASVFAQIVHTDSAQKIAVLTQNIS